jgi:hypothetical protein
MDRTCVVDGRPYQENDEMMEKKVLPRDIYGEIKSKIAAKEVINLLEQEVQIGNEYPQGTS